MIKLLTFFRSVSLSCLNLLSNDRMLWRSFSVGMFVYILSKSRVSIVSFFTSSGGMAFIFFMNVSEFFTFSGFILLVSVNSGDRIHVMSFASFVV